MYRVYHATNLAHMIFNVRIHNPYLQPRFPDDYQLVAEVEAETADEAYDLTNNIDKRWVTNDEVTLMHLDHKRGKRSSSVGDIIENKETGSLLIVAPFGWEHACYGKVTPNFMLESKAFQEKYEREEKEKAEAKEAAYKEKIRRLEVALSRYEAVAARDWLTKV